MLRAFPICASPPPPSHRESADDAKEFITPLRACTTRQPSERHACAVPRTRLTHSLCGPAPPSSAGSGRRLQLFACSAQRLTRARLPYFGSAPVLHARACCRRLDENLLTGTIPREFGALTALESLYAAWLPVSTMVAPRLPSGACPSHPSHLKSVRRMPWECVTHLLWVHHAASERRAGVCRARASCTHAAGPCRSLREALPSAAALRSTHDAICISFPACVSFAPA